MHDLFDYRNKHSMITIYYLNQSCNHINNLAYSLLTGPLCNVTVFGIMNHTKCVIYNTNAYQYS
jgi:hypothetical protein